MTLPEYDHLDATALAELVARREVSPGELVEAAIARIEARDGRIGAVPLRLFEDARRSAAGALAEGPFRGVPFLLKDQGARWAGRPLTASTRLLASHVAAHDSELVRRLLGAGVVILGRTSTPELGIMPVTEPRLRGPTRNPWDRTRTPGGSSGGSAAAVAARMVPAAHGSDGGGSIRIPSAACGCFGLKPTRGRVSFAPDHGERWGGLSQEHVITRSVRDSAALLDLLAGYVPGDPYLAPPPERPFAEEARREPGRLRVAFTAASLLGETTHPEHRAALERAVKLLADLGHEVEEGRPALDRDELVRAFFAILAAAVCVDVEDVARTAGRKPARADFEPETWMLAVIGRRTSSAELLRAREVAHRAGRDAARFFRRFDVLVTPTTPHPPARVGESAPGALERAALFAASTAPARRLLDAVIEKVGKDGLEPVANTQLWNLTGQPAASVPLEWSAQGMPIGIQLAGRFGEESVLLRLAAQLETARPWAARLPPDL